MSRCVRTAPALLLAVALAGAGCGGSSGGGGTGGGTPTTKDQAISQCLERARQFKGDARKTAEAACNAAKTGNTTAVKDAARQQCLNAAKQVPAGPARDQAEQACKSGTK